MNIKNNMVPILAITCVYMVIFLLFKMIMFVLLVEILKTSKFIKVSSKCIYVAIIGKYNIKQYDEPMATIIVWSYVSTSASMILKSSGVRDGDRENGACNVKQISLPLRMLEMSKL